MFLNLRFSLAILLSQKTERLFFLNIRKTGFGLPVLEINSFVLIYSEDIYSSADCVFLTSEAFAVSSPLK